MKSYSETIEFLYGARLFGMKLGLQNIRHILDRLGCPEERFFTVHVAGTNGKGSVVAMVESVLRKAGLKTGLFTSPHISSFRERFRTSGEMIECDEVVRIVEMLMPIVEEMKSVADLEHPTFYELATAIAAQYFSERGVEVAVIETGLGGRLDATNALPAKVSVITSIGLEHQEYLGDTIEEIAAEKAGIIKEGCSVVLSSQAPEAMRVLEEIASKRNAQVSRVGKEITWSGYRMSGDIQAIDIRTQTRVYDEMVCPLLGLHQANNLCAAIGAIEALGDYGFSVSEHAVRQGIADVEWPARFEIVRHGPTFILDAAANPHAARCLAETLEEWNRTEKRIILVFGMLNDKDCRGFAEIVAPLAHEIIVTEPESERAVSAGELSAIVRQAGFSGEMRTVPVLSEALKAASERAAKEKGCVLVTGSLYLMGRAREFLKIGSIEEDISLTDKLSDVRKEKL